MSPRSRHARRSSGAPAAPGYPTPAERQAIIERRDELFQQVIRLLAEERPPSDPAYDRLRRQYGDYEVQRQLGLIQKQAIERDFLIDEPLIYRKYRQTFARFGGQRRFLRRPEFEALVFENATTMARRRFLSPPPIAPPGPRERELTDLTLVNVEAWEDVTPPAIPPRPEDFFAPRGDEYGGPEKDLLAWGWDLDLQRVYAQAENTALWQPAVPDLLRMVFDKGLLNGWPGEPASWAPYYALFLVGALKVFPAATRLLSLADHENDWLSDCLPAVWTLIGPPVEPGLWSLLDDASYADDRRGMVIAGLRLLAATFPNRRTAIVGQLAERLASPNFTNPIVNAYIVFALNRLKAREARQAIAAAFEQGKVATRIMQPSAVDFL